jgi:hypothetical protein
MYLNIKISTLHAGFSPISFSPIMDQRGANAPSQSSGQWDRNRVAYLFAKLGQSEQTRSQNGSALTSLNRPFWVGSVEQKI